MLGALFAKLLGWIPSPWSGVRLKHHVAARMCTYAHPYVTFGHDPPGSVHVDLWLELWVPEHRTTVREMAADAAGQALDANIFLPFQAMTLEPGAAPETQSVAVGPPDGEELRAKVGDKVAIRLGLTRGRTRKLKVPLRPETSDGREPRK